MDNLKEKIKSRKFIQSSFVLLTATILMAFGSIDDGTYIAAIGASQAIYSYSNVREKEKRKGDDY